MELTLRKKIYTNKHSFAEFSAKDFLCYNDYKEVGVMEELYNYLIKSEKVYLLERRKTVKWWHMLFDFVGFLYFWGEYGKDKTYDCYLVKFEKYWEILVCKKGKALEKIKLKEKFELKKKFLCGDYKYKVHHEITHELYNYLKYSC